MHRHLLLHCSCPTLVLTLLACASPALAQTAPVAAEAAPDDDTAILVTARRSSERLQDVPLAITTQSAEMLQERGISDLEGIARITPGLQFKDFVTTFHGNATLRGLAQINTSNPVGNVGVFVNGIYLQRGYMVDTSLGDFSRIEVVKGPQSALYGQNTFGGAINYVSNAPTDELHGDGEITYGNYGRKEVQAAVGGPIVDGLLSARIYVAKSLYGGSWKNNASGNLGDLKRFGGYDRDAFSGALKFTPTDRLTVNLFYQRNHREEELRPYYTLDGTFTEDRLNCGPVNATTGRPSLFCGQFQVNPSASKSGVGTPAAVPFSVDQPKTITTTQIASASVDYDFSDAIQAHYVYGWTKGSAQENLGAFSNTVNPTGRATISPQHEGGVLNYDSHEVRIGYDDKGPFTLEMGYFHSNARDEYLFGNRAVAPGQTILRLSSDPLFIPTGFLTLTNYDAHYRTDSVFGRGTLKFFDDRLTLGAEGRYTWTQVRYFDKQTPTLPELKADYGNLSPRFTVDYKLTPASMIYASAAKGVKSGGFNGRRAGTVTLTADEQSYGEEENWTYEVGSKNSFFGSKLIANVALFYIDWSKKQNSVQPSGYVNTGVFTPGTVPPNSYQTTGAAKSYGIEIEGMARPFAGFTINYSAAAMNPEYNKGVIAGNFIGLCTGVNCPISADIGGNQIERTSKFAGTLGFEYRKSAVKDFEMFVGSDVTYQSKQYSDPVNESWIGSYTLVNARIGIQNDTWKAWLHVDNLFDKKYIQSVFVIQNTRLNQVAYGERRTIGGTLAFNF
jgi:iron complex outermembrane receptor protein